MIVPGTRDMYYDLIHLKRVSEQMDHMRFKKVATCN